MLQFRMLGSVELKDSQGRDLDAVLRRPKLLALLGYLTIARPRGFHRRDTLVALLWPELDQAHARNALSQAVHALRQALGREVLRTRGEEELGTIEEGLSCDVREFEAALEGGAAERALELYRGSLLNGFHISEVPEFERWLDEERERVRRRACDGAQLLIDRDDGAGNPVGAARWALRLTELSPFDETAVRRLVELLDHVGDRAGAVRAYEEFERRLGRDLEVAPSSATQGLIAEIKVRRPELSEGLGVPVPKPRTVIQALLGRTRRPHARRRRTLLVLGLVVGGLLTGGWFLFASPFRARSAETTREAKRLVVLPFANLGPAEDQYFADGITEEITTRLASVERLRVIGRTSANAYKDTKKTLQQIGAELGVDYVVEGAIRWEKSPRGPARVRITPQLVSTSDGTHLWAQIYDEPLDEIFRVQGDIAQRVVRALDVTLLAAQRRLVEASPTGNLQAYDFYLRGNEYMRNGSGGSGSRAAQRMYERAIELDPRFALAYARLSRVHSRIYLSYEDRSPDRVAQAKRAVDKAFELDPNLAEAHHSLATYYWIGYRDYERAIREFAIAESSRPNDSEIFLARAVMRQRQGKIREALVDFETAWQLDPASAVVATSYALTYELLRDYRQAEVLYDRAIALAYDGSAPYFMKTHLYLLWEGSTRKARAVLDEARTVGVGNKPLVVLAGVWVDTFDRRYGDALARLSAGAPEVIEDQNRFIPRTQLCAQIYGLMQRHDLERAYYDSARILVSKRIAEHTEDPRLHSALGIAYAGLGRKREAIQEGQKAVELLPITKEAAPPSGHHLAVDLARINTMVRESGAAVDQLQHLLSIPGLLSSAWLRLDPTWDPLRSDPRFQRLLDRER
ncbi:MAG TPA: BTAD domain-containing putative transcriptional regulator [Gemmatimonadales bacterium]|jgi:TolB-like protein/DNA-binding SARP family transcriptional activator/Flp pilus assembly protein TadD